MSVTLVDQVRRQANQIGYKPRFGIEVPDILACFSRSIEFDVWIGTDVDGVTNAPADDTRFDAASMDTSDFIINLDILVIIGGANAGEYLITSIEAGTAITCDSAAFSTGTGQKWKVVRRHEDLLTNFPSFNFYSNELGGLGSVSDFNFGIINNELYSSSLFTTYPDIENSAVNAFLYFDDGTDIGYTERVQLYSGVIKTFPKINYDAINFSVADRNQLYGVPIGDSITDSFVQPSFALPDEALGRLQQIVYGDHYFYRGAAGAGVGASQVSPNGYDLKHNMVKAIPLGGFRFLVCGHLAYEIEALWVFDDALQRMVKLVEFTIIQNTVNGVIVEIGEILDSGTDGAYSTAYGTDFSATAGNFTNGAEDDWLYITDGADEVYRRIKTITDDDNIVLYEGFDWTGTGLTYRLLTDNQYVYDFWYGRGGHNSTSAAWNNPKYSNDGDINLLRSSMTTEFLSWITINTRLEYDAWDNVDIPDADIDEVRVFGRVSCGIRTGSPSFTVNSVDATGDSVNDINDYSTQAATQAGITTYVNVYATDDGTDAVMECQIYDIFKRIKYKPAEFPTDIYVSMAGKEYDANINGRATAEGFTETHINDDDSGQLIQNAAGAIEWLSRDAGLATAAINEDSFNIASNDLSTSDISFTVSRQDDWKKHISDVAMKVKSLVFFDHTDTLKMTVFNGPAGFSATGFTKPGNWDIFDESPTQTFLIVENVNDTLHWEHPGPGTKASVVPPGQYTGASLAAAIQVLIATIGGATCTYSSTTGKFTIYIPFASDYYWTNTSRQIGRYIGFDITSDDITSTVVSDTGLWENSWVENPIIDGSFSLTKQVNAIYTDIDVPYYQNYKTNQFQEKLNDTDTTYHALVKNEYKNPYTKDATTGTLYLNFLIDRLARRHYVAEFKTFMNAIHLEPWDIINIRQPILAGIFGESTMNDKEWLVLGISYSTSDMTMSIKAIEV